MSLEPELRQNLSTILHRVEQCEETFRALIGSLPEVSNENFEEVLA